MSDSDARDHGAALQALLAVGLQGHAYRYDRVPGTAHNRVVTERVMPLPNIYVVYSVGRRFNGSLRYSAETDVTLWRATIQHVGRTVREAQWAALRVAEGLEYASLAIGDSTTTPIQFELDQEPEPDEGRFTGRSQWTYSL